MTARVYAISNRKGGSGKTTTTGAMASCLTRLGYKVLAIDMDPQGDLTDWSGYDTNDKLTVYEVLMGYADIVTAIYPREGHYDILGADEILWNTLSEMSVKNESDLTKLKNAIDTVRESYDFILIDTPPSFGILAFNSYIAATSGLVVTSDTSAFATRALEELLDSVEHARDYNANAYPVGILLTKYNGRSKAMRSMREISKEFGEYWNIPVYETVIRNTTGVAEAQMNVEDILETKNNLAAKDYMAFCHEFLRMEGLEN